MNRLQLLDYGRFFAAFWVILFHYTYNGILNGKITSVTETDAITAITKYGYLGVEFFFMISGYVIFFSSRNRASHQFLSSRATRLFPAYWISVIITTVFTLTISNNLPEITYKQVLINLTMLSSLFNTSFVDGVYWTLTYELIFYTSVFLALLLGLSKYLKLIFQTWPFFMLFAIYCQKDWLPLAGGYYSFFAAGAAFAIIKEDKSKLSYISLAITLLLCLNFSVNQAIQINSTKGSDYSLWIIGIIIIIFFLYFLIQNTQRVASIKLPKASLLGSLTYPIYLIHAHVGYILINHFANDENKVFIYPLIILLVGFIAYLIHSLVEKKMANFWKRFFTKHIGRPIAIIEKRVLNRNEFKG